MEFPLLLAGFIEGTWTATRDGQLEYPSRTVCAVRKLHIL